MRQVVYLSSREFKFKRIMSLEGWNFPWQPGQGSMLESPESNNKGSIVVARRDHCDTKALLKKACESGKLREGSKLYQNIERVEHT